jgi:dihydroorotate dehydrogenase
MGKLEIQGDRLPIFIGAGIIKEKADIDRLAQDKILLGATLGSFTMSQRFVPDRRFDWDAQKQIASNRMILHNPGRWEAGSYLPESIKKLHDVGMLVILSVAAAPGEDPREVLPYMAEWTIGMGADGVELDASCPSLELPRLICQDLEDLDGVVELTRRAIGPDPALVVKVSNLSRPDINDLVAAELPVDIWTVANSVRGKSGPGLNKLFRLNTIDWVDALRAVGREEDAQVLSVGGVEGSAAGGAEVYDRVHNLGALAVGIAQAAYRATDLQQMVAELASGYRQAAQVAQIPSGQTVA